MKYGKIRIEEGNLVFIKHMMTNNLPCKDILWAYMRREGLNSNEKKQLIVNYLVIVTRRRKRYKFDMTEREIQDCISLLKALNPDMAVGFPKGGRISGLQSMPNTRDLGALVTEDGRHILPRKLLRSGNLYHISLADQKILSEEYHLTKVIDFRISKEREKKPDTLMANVKYCRIPIVDEETSTDIHIGNRIDLILNGEITEEKMCILYENFIKDQYCVKQYARFLDELLHQDDGAVLWHSNFGKDRTGIGTALLLCVLGVSRDVIMEDFLRSNIYLDSELEYTIRLLEAKTIVSPEIMERMRILFKVKEEYLKTVFDTIDRYYGNADRFIRRALYLTPKAIEDLKNKYLI